MDYKPLAEYGLIGNLETCSLVGSDGSIDWFPVPELASPSVFAAVLDADRGGQFSVRPAADYTSSQSYRHRTNVLETVFETSAGTAALTDFMPAMGNERTTSIPSRAIYREIECTDGRITVDIDFSPRFDYARADTTIERTDRGVVAQSNGERLFLSAPVAFELNEGDEREKDGPTARARHTLEAGDSIVCCLQYGTYDPLSTAEYDAALMATLDYWREWVRRCTHPSRCVVDSPRFDLVIRSGLVLKLLMHWSTGAIAAAPTTSLPEEIGGVRNWDYRFSWLRDAAFTVQALYRLGNTEEAKRYFSWCLGLAESDLDGLSQPLYRPLYGLHGETDLNEQIIDGFEGYRGSGPVRVGNAARDQRQLDVYGELMLAVHETSWRGEALSEDTWHAVKDIVEQVRRIWNEPDSGIWEVRSVPQQFVYSKVMCWAALDRGIDIARRQDFDAPIDAWSEARGAIKETVLEHGYNEARATFTQTFESDTDLDATSLLLPVVGFLPFDDPRVQGTIDAVLAELTTEDGLVYRYNGDDGIAGDENPFVLCSFWLVDALSLSGRLDEARVIFDSLTDMASPLGLLGEEIDPETGEARGNFPQAFSHIGLINSALYLSEASSALDTGVSSLVPEPLSSAPGLTGRAIGDIDFEPEPGRSD